MKKCIFVVAFVFLVVLPFNVKAINIDTVTLKGDKDGEVGDEITITMQAYTSTYGPDEGIWIADTELSYDKNYLSLVSYSASGFITSIDYTDDGVELESLPIENSGVDEMCVDNQLYCGTYTLVLKFKINNVTQQVNSTIEVTNFGVGSVIAEEGQEITADAIRIVVYSDVVLHDILLKPATSTVSTTSTPTTSNSESKTVASTSTSVQSNDNYLKSLEIENYNIDFNKYKTNYVLNIDDDINQLNIKPTTNSDKATYIINGNENLKDGSIIKITVTAEDKSTMDYQIGIKKGDSKTDAIVDNNDDGDTKQNFDSVSKKITLGIGLLFAFFLVIALITVISSVIDKKKFNKLLNEEKK